MLKFCRRLLIWPDLIKSCYKAFQLSVSLGLMHHSGVNMHEVDDSIDHDRGTGRANEAESGRLPRVHWRRPASPSVRLVCSLAGDLVRAIGG
jgi:hypothetical protein